MAKSKKRASKKGAGPASRAQVGEAVLSIEGADGFFQSLFDTVREPLIVLDRDLKIVTLNRAYQSVFGGAPCDAEGRSIFEIADHRWDLPTLHTLLEREVPTYSAVDDYKIEGDLKGLGPKKLLLNARRVLVDHETVGHVILAIMDVTERERYRAALEERTARLQALLAAVPDAIINIDEKGTIGSFSAGAERLFGYTESEVIGQNVSMLMPPPDRDRHDGYIETYLKTGRKRIIGVGREVEGLRKDGSRAPLLLNVTESKLNGARVFTGVLHDLTEQRRTEDELRQARKMEIMGQLVGGVAHDFNNLLTVISGNLEMLDNRVTEDFDRELVGDARQAAKLAATLTGHMLAFARRQALNPSKIEVNELVLDVTDLLRHMIDESIHVATQLGKDVPAVFADEPSLRAALLNLAVNARDAMQNGGELTIETARMSAGSTSGEAPPNTLSGDLVSITVTDTGAGIPPEIIDRVAEPFFTTKEVGKGSGLGLSMVYGFAKQSGGDIEIESAPGKGAIVRILLPATDESAANEAPSKRDAAPAPKGGDNEHVLLVEDDASVRKVTARRLTELGYVVTEAEDGVAALELLGSGRAFDLLFTDVVMPHGLNGAELARKARQRQPQIRVLFTSGYPVDELALGSDDVVLRKPYDASELAARVGKALQA